MPSTRSRRERGVEGEQEVQYTISKDHSRGLEAQTESSYGALEARDPAAELGMIISSIERRPALESLLNKKLDRYRSLVALTQANGPRLSESSYPTHPPPPPNRKYEDGSWSELQAADDADFKPDGSLAQAAATIVKLPDNQHHIVLHRVSCTANVKGCDRQIYQEEPSKLKIKGVMHLASGTAIDDLDQFLEAHHQICFVVYRDYQCGDSHLRWVSTIDKFSSRLAAKFVRETVSIVSEELQADICAISKFAPNHKDSRSHNAQSLTSLLTKSPSEYTHYFLYHHRDRIHSAAADCGTGDTGALAALSAFLRGNPDPMYEKCDKLFGQNLVSAETLPWLFQVNEPLVSTDENLKLAYVLARPGELMDDGTITLGAWNWGYDGRNLRRSMKEIYIVFPVQSTVSIGDLSAYPMQYAGEEVKRDLFETGERFWELRGHNHVSYEGPDYNGEREYVSPCHLQHLTSILKSQF